MPRIAKKYEKLALTDDYLTDPLLMALAWKKSHQYIRTTNWYADHFELDLSALSLAATAENWCSNIKQRRFNFKKLELVPAPKQYKWNFQDDKPDTASSNECLYWYPIEPADEVPLRPLAHVPIREQSMMTLLMMCLANDVETLQGDPSTDFELVHEKGIVNYGNRLYCRYGDDGKAEHSYGATTIYSKFFTDNRRFLERPYHFAQQARNELSDEQDVFMVELDLSKFFDLVDRKMLCKKVKALAIAQSEQESELKFVDKLLLAFEAWNWSEQATVSFETLCKSDEVLKAPKGIPQGVVAGGFLSNIYLLEFDNAVKSLIGKQLNDDCDIDITLVDYCRYVDDMRLVVTSPKHSSLTKKRTLTSCQVQRLASLKEQVILSVEKLFENMGLNTLRLNKKKTKVELYKPRTVGLSGELTKLQNRLSGPISFDDSQEYLGQLEALLSMVGSGSYLEQGEDCVTNLLAQIEQKHLDIRDDSLKRFATNKIAKVLKIIRNFTAHSVDDNGKYIPCDWDYQQERLARRLIACWSLDPSLVVLLKKGLELFPCSKLINPVLQQLKHKLGDKNEKVKAVAEYCLSEIFRHASTTIHRLDPKYIPLHADHETFFEQLQYEAVEICGNSNFESEKNFNLLAEQARFLLLVRLDTTLEQGSGNEDYDLIIKLSKGFRKISLNESFTSEKLAANILLAEQLTNDSKPLIRAVSCLLDGLKPTECMDVLSNVSVQNIRFFNSLVMHARPLEYQWPKQQSTKNLIKLHGTDKRPLKKALESIKGSQSLLRLIQRPDNPFANELMALKLMQALLDKSTKLATATPNALIDITTAKVELMNSSYSLPPQFNLFDCSLNIEFDFTSSIPLLSTHLTNGDTVTRVLQRVAICTRSALIGNTDWSGYSSNIEPMVGYRGIKTSSDKRALGMMNTPHSIAGESAQVSHWLTTLLSKLLIWPGISVNDQGYDWPVLWEIDSVRKLVENRLNELKSKYCKQTAMPGLIEAVNLDWQDNKKNLTVAMVQSKLPSNNDFKQHGIMLEDINFRSRHRRHVADIAALVCKHIDAQRTHDLERRERGKQVDLIVWPELAVNHDDMDILVTLSRKTHSIIYAGLGFINQDNTDGPNNCAVWIVPPKANSEQKELIRLQGKHNMTPDEAGKIKPWRPYQLMLELKHPKFPNKPGFMLTGSICYDSTDISLSADLRDKSNAYVVCALNKDVNTFDTMIDALHYHMYQPVVLVNSGVYGGSCAKAPYSEPYHRLIAHSHGNDQVSINTFEMNMFDFRRDNVGGSMKSDKLVKTQPAGVVEVRS
ncbi:RNA-directed DNA polymerase [Shewanella sp. Isolate11]|uniref:RNA-directed DNA polymerase n=1 Tax=Shewanella sp. Isolate11 TaxID=2908530 RepID=UPI001EFD6E34|nr:RNA-directed DNA polymerase [Shewanella sp. Isolate11]MCG9697239.1 RNA-directed DNA polymerase [Shewanella sp. Isolate11]